MLVLPRYAISVRLACFFRSKRIVWLCGAVASLSLVCIVSLVSRARGDSPGPRLVAANVEPAPAPASKPAVPSASNAASKPADAFAAAIAEAGRVLEGVSTMQAVMEKRERVKGRLEPMQRIEIKVRRSPRSVYMRWQSPDEGQEVVWQENANGNQILVHPSGWRGRLMPMVRIDPKSPRVVEQSRRPIETAGLWTLNKQLSELAGQAQKAGGAIRVDVAADQTFAGRKCTRYRLGRSGAIAAGDFQSVVIYIDAATKVPVGFERYLPGSRSEPVLDEYYAYRDLRLNAPLADRDFDASNPAYHFSDTAEPAQPSESLGSKSGNPLK